jgi:hypothetical protein
MKKKKSGKGGDRGGRKPLLYGEETKPVTTKVPKSKIPQFKKEVKEKVLKKWETKKKK